MSSSSAGLLAGLASGVRPLGAGSEGSRRVGMDAPGAPDFASLLRQARSGAISSGKPVTISESVGVRLSEQQLARLAQAADVAEASGATRALVLMDGMAIKLDVGVRTVLGAGAFDAESVMTGFDAIVRVPEEGAASMQKAPTLPAGLQNASLLNMLSRERAAN